MNAGFQRTARRDKKAFLSDQCKEIEENNRMGKIRDLFKKIRDTKGTFHAKMGSIKDRNCLDLTGAEDIKKRWQEYTEELYKKDLHDPDNHDGVITDLQPETWYKLVTKLKHSGVMKCFLVHHGLLRTPFRESTDDVLILFNSLLEKM